MVEKNTLSADMRCCVHFIANGDSEISSFLIRKHLSFTDKAASAAVGRNEKKKIFL